MANSKLIFSVETSSNVCGVAAIDGNEILSSVEKTIPRKHAEILPSYFQKVMHQAGKTLKDFDAVAVSIGPGSFTGLRIGLGFAKGLAYSHGLPIVPVPTLEAMAFGVKDAKPSRGIAFSHSKKVFYQEFDWHDEIPFSKAKATAGEIDEFFPNLSTDGVAFQWNCDTLIPESIELLPAKPSATDVGLLGSKRYDEWITAKPFDLVPEYVLPFRIKSNPS